MRGRPQTPLPTAGATAVAGHRRKPDDAGVVFLVVTRRGFDEIRSRVVVGRDAVWVNAGVVSESEAVTLREAGWDFTVWSNRLDTSDLRSDIETVRMHHPGQIIWTEVAEE